jgi:hypothetical protein
MNLGTTRLRGRPRNKWQDEVKDEVRVVGGEECRKKYITERNGMNEWLLFCFLQVSCFKPPSNKRLVVRY